MLLLVAVPTSDHVVDPSSRPYNCTDAPAIAAPVSGRVNRPVNDTELPEGNVFALLEIVTAEPVNVTALGLLSLPDQSRTHTANVYVDPSVRPIAVTLDPVPAYTAVPDVTDGGAVVPIAARTIT